MIRENLWLASDYDRVMIFLTYFFLDLWNVLDCWWWNMYPKHGGKTWRKQKKKPKIVAPIEEKCANNCLVLASKQLSTRIQMKINWQINSQELKEAKLHKRKMKGFEEQEVDIQYLKGYDILRKNDCGHQFELLCALNSSRVVTHTMVFKGLRLRTKWTQLYPPPRFISLQLSTAWKKSAQLGLCCCYLLLLWRL